uniref:Uncharacterized protein n=1 Tax=Coccidioides posadasii RMSCC 3488 TaxID=454284 RepID=A0A0J6F803_COCPO|nr:hypothetical protein CPAG_02642 [Coccidioides posadasii RMSCC 3488]
MLALYRSASLGASQRQAHRAAGDKSFPAAHWSVRSRRARSRGRFRNPTPRAVPKTSVDIKVSRSPPLTSSAAELLPAVLEFDETLLIAQRTTQMFEGCGQQLMLTR